MVDYRVQRLCEQKIYYCIATSEDPTIFIIMSTTPNPRCILDRAILNEETLGDMDDVGLSVFASLCGANRGAFVLQPPDGNTYG
jgi:hypothetical protein